MQNSITSHNHNLYQLKKKQQQLQKMMMKKMMKKADTSELTHFTALSVWCIYDDVLTVLCQRKISSKCREGNYHILICILLASNADRLSMVLTMIPGTFDLLYRSNSLFEKLDKSIVSITRSYYKLHCCWVFVPIADWWMFIWWFMILRTIDLIYQR